MHLQLETKGECLLLVACLRVALGTERQDDLNNLLQRPLRWDEVLELATWHDVLPLLHKVLAGKEAVPVEVRERLQRNFEEGAKRSLHLLGEQIRIDQLMRAQGLNVLLWKGPILAARLYGSCSYRTSCDIDLLAPARDCPRALEVLYQMGYIIPSSRLNEQQLSYWQKTQHEARLVHPGTYAVIELHDAILPEYFLLKQLNSCAVFSRARESDGKFPVLALSPEDEFLALCGHGTKHSWDRLKWLCDIVQFFRHYANVLDWKRELAHATRHGCRNVVLLAAGLARELLQAPVPAPLQKALKANASMEFQAAMLAQRTLAGLMGAKNDVERSRLHFAVMQNSGSRLFYLLRKITWVNPQDLTKYAPIWKWRVAYYFRRILGASAKGFAYLRPNVK
jgi:hypothetical protein